MGQALAAKTPHRSDQTKILEFWRWRDIGAAELTRLSSVAVEYGKQHYAYGDASWSIMMRLEWERRGNLLKEASEASPWP
jgi:hypothetical protein